MIDLNGAKDPVIVHMRKSHTFQEFVNGATLTAIGALIVVIIMLYIAQITFSADFSLQEMGLECVVLYLATCSISLLSRSYARRKGRDTDGYIKARERVESLNGEIISKGFSALAKDYCREWETAELASQRHKVLSAVGISLKDFEEKYVKYNKRELQKHYPDLSEDEIKTILRAKKIKRLHYDENYLTISQKGYSRHAPGRGFNSSTLNGLRIAQVFVVGAISAFFSAALVLEVIANPSWQTVLTCAIKVITVVVFSVFGMIGGYNLSAVRETGELGEKADEQQRFMKWCDGFKKAEKPEVKPAEVKPVEVKPVINTIPANESGTVVYNGTA